MLHDLDMNYDDIISKYLVVVDYAGKFSDSFSLMTNLKKPYSKVPPNCEHDEILKPLEPYLLEQKIGLKEWPGTIKASVDNHKVMNIYRSCKETRAILLKMPNAFLFSNSLPEDICFYRNKKPWFVTVSHEKITFMLNASEDDMAFFQEQKIHFHF